MVQAQGVNYDGLLPSRANFPRGTQSKVVITAPVSASRTKYVRWSRRLQQGHPSQRLGTSKHIGDPDRTAVIEMPKDVKAELH
jgi:hypothetical protein